MTATRIGSYEVLRELGRGAMGVVYAARSPELGREVAIKLITQVDPSGDQLLRFEREARIAARLRHPNVVFIHHVGNDAGRPFIVMDLVAGESLAQRLSRTGPLPPRDAAWIVAKLARGLEHAHAQGVLHRDVKPQNVLLDALGEPVLADFGLARELVGGPEKLTVTGAVVGTPSYMPPEQADGGGRIGAPADVYALGATLFELLCGEPPFRGRGVIDVLNKVIQTPAPRVSSRRANIPAELDRLVADCLAKEPTRRPGAGALATALEAWLGKAELTRPAPAPLGPILIACAILVSGALVAAALLGRSGRAAPAPQVPAVAPSPPAPSPPSPTAEALRAFARGSQCGDAGDEEGALREYARALELDPGLAQVHVNRANIHNGRGDLVAALADLDRALAIDPDFPLARINRAFMRRDRGDAASALEDCIRAVDLCKGPPIPDRWGAGVSQAALLARALALRGWIRIKLGQRTEAVADLNEAALLESTDPRVWQSIASARIEMGDRVAARHALSHAIRLDPKDAISLFRRAYLQDDRAARLADFEAAIGRLPPDSPLAAKAARELEQLRAEGR